MSDWQLGRGGNLPATVVNLPPDPAPSQASSYAPAPSPVSSYDPAPVFVSSYAPAPYPAPSYATAPSPTTMIILTCVYFTISSVIGCNILH